LSTTDERALVVEAAAPRHRDFEWRRWVPLCVVGAVVAFNLVVVRSAVWAVEIPDDTAFHAAMPPQMTTAHPRIAPVTGSPCVNLSAAVSTAFPGAACRSEVDVICAACAFGSVLLGTPVSLRRQFWQ